MKKIFVMLSVVLLLCSLAVSSFAAIPDLNRKSELTVTVKYGDKVIPGGFISLYRVADMSVVDGEIEYTLTEKFKDCKVDFSGDTEKLLKAFTDHIYTNRIEGDRRMVDAEGQIAYSELEAGYYIGIQDQSGEGYIAPNPFATSLPVVDSDGNYSYIVKVNSKVEPADDESNNEKDTTSRPSRPGNNLPQTGQLKWPIPILSVCGAGILIIGCVLLVLGKRKRNEK